MSETLKLAAFCGSLRKASLNRLALTAFATQPGVAVGRVGLHSGQLGVELLGRDKAVLHAVNSLR